jgi:hypothetical protein
MYIAIQHNISNPTKFREAAESIMPRIPEGVKPHSFLPDANYAICNCLWEADSLEQVKTFLESEIGAYSKNDYYVVDAAAAIGLPEAYVGSGH